MQEPHASTQAHQVPAGERFDFSCMDNHLPECQVNQICIRGDAVAKVGFTMLLEIQSPPGLPCVLYPLGSFEKVREFRQMLAYPLNGERGDNWEGVFFFAFENAYEPGRIYWRGHPDAITICVTADQWEDIRAAFDDAFARLEYARLWVRLCAERGRE